MQFLEKYFSGHINIGKRITIFGFNAMHVALEIKIKNGWLLIHPPVYCFGKWWKWYIYYSPNGTPNQAIWGFGPGFFR